MPPAPVVAVPDTVLERVLFPLLTSVRSMLGVARHVQAGHVQVYLVYVAAALIAGSLGASTPRS